MSGDLLGIDVGFSKQRRSTGIALLQGNQLQLYRADVSWKDRRRGLPKDFQPLIIGIDGPLIPHTSPEDVVRPCEAFFSRGIFARRCKPGMSHFGTGYLLRRAASDVFDQFCGRFFGDSARLGKNVVEAFPNLFLGVLVRKEEFDAIPELQRGKRFDWLYDQASKRISKLGQFCNVPDSVFRRVEREDDHELRAALVCLLTAALAASGKAVRCGDDKGGWFWLPPLEAWEPWAAAEITTRKKGFFPQYDDMVVY